ncbi:hypothetical protein QYE76_061149 [Lolium multiflorum]|uniref:SEC12-like protein 1 n=1 Tax=Lolium multiflorum TaxID=4521 RepID=A0AAD8S136_LOLMU|nr:hypothetical protein QYE76_061149 [Lolium multiflorum]
MAGGDGGTEPPAWGVVGKVTCAAWIRRSGGGANRLLVVYGRAGTASSPPILDLFTFDARACTLASEPLLRIAMGEDEDDAPRAIAVHPGGAEFVCATAKGCRQFKLVSEDFSINLIAMDSPPLQSVGPQRCLAFSTDSAKFATGGEDGHLRIFHWPSLRLLLDEPKAHKSFRDMDISLDSLFLVSTSTDGSARIWKIDEGVPLVNLTRSADEKIECCCFSRNGKKPFLFCTLVKGNDILTMVLDITNWKRIGYKRLLRKPISTISVSLDGKYLALGSHDGDCCVVDVQSMQVSHLIKKVHLGSPISSIEFCPIERIVLSTSHQWGAEITKLDVPSDWRVWQIWLLLLSFFLASAVAFYTFFKHTTLL